MTEESDRAEILAVIHANRIALWTYDFDAYAECFVHADYLMRWNAGWKDGIFMRSGWDNIAARLRATFADRSFYNPANAYDTKVVDLVIRLSGDMAWASFDQLYPGEPQLHRANEVRLLERHGGDHLDPGEPQPHRTHEVRFFERHGGKWRIAFLGFMDNYPSDAGAALMHLAPDGTVLWRSPAADGLLDADDDLVIRGSRLRIRDSRADQKLQAAIKWAAGLGTGLVTGRGALPIVLEAGEGLPTKIWWVIAESGMILFSLGDPALIGRRLDAAAAVYGLSPTQKQLAALVAEGLSLHEIAERMQITANTARTHLNRVFDKTGVRTQPALVRVLLTAAAPI